MFWQVGAECFGDIGQKQDAVTAMRVSRRLQAWVSGYI